MSSEAEAISHQRSTSLVLSQVWVANLCPRCHSHSCQVSDEGEAQDACVRFGFPLMLKSRRNAYDGRGNAVVRSQEGLAAAVEGTVRSPQHGTMAWLPYHCTAMWLPCHSTMYGHHSTALRCGYHDGTVVWLLQQHGLVITALQCSKFVKLWIMLALLAEIRARCNRIAQKF